MPQQSSWDSSLSSWGRVSTHEMSQQWAPCNRNIKPHLILLALPILTEREMAFSPFILLASWYLRAQLEKSSLRLWHLQNPSAFQQSSGNVRTAAADSSSPILSLAYSLLHCLPLLSSLPDSIFFVVVLSKLWKHSCSFFLPLVLRSLGCIDHRLSPTCCTCLVVALIMDHSRDQEQTGPGLATEALGLFCWLRSPLMYEDVCGSAAEF